MRYSLRVCPECENELFGLVMAEGHPYYYCPNCKIHFERPELLKIELDYKEKFYVYDVEKKNEKKEKGK